VMRTYHDGLPEEEYRRELTAIDTAMSALVDPLEDEVIYLGDHVEGMLEAWHLATKEEKRNLLTMMLESVYVDTKETKVLALLTKANRAFDVSCASVKEGDGLGPSLSVPGVIKMGLRKCDPNPEKQL